MTRRAILRLALAAPVASTLVAAPTILTVAAPRPVEPRVRRIPVKRESLGKANPVPHQAGGRPARETYGLETVSTDRFTVAAFTWDGGPSDATMLIRTHQRDAGWSDWFALQDDGHGPDPGTPEARGARHGTDPIVVAESDAVEVQVQTPDGELPGDLQVELIDPGNSPADRDAGTRRPGAADAAVLVPTVLTRAHWGADESIRSQSSPSHGSVRGAFVHHTAGSNSYSQADVPGIIRGIYAYHVNGRGWRDVGYNFFVDRFGRMWEGRFGGMERAVVGAHAAGYNTHSVGISVLGTYTSKRPESAVLTAFARLIAWKFGVHGVGASGTVAYPGLSTLPKISGHRDGSSTECPGSELYSRLGTIRSRVESSLATSAWPGLPTSFTRGIDAAFWRPDNNRFYFFKGNQYVRYRSGRGVDSGYPRPIAGNWRGLPSAYHHSIDAALWRGDNDRIYFFSGDQYVRFSAVSNGVDSSYPRPIAGNWPGLPTSFTRGIDAAFWRPDNNRIYFFKGNQYVRYRSGRGVDSGYPRPIAGNWRGLPSAYHHGIDGALSRGDNNRSYFFTGNQYIRFSSVSNGVDSGYPKLIGP